MSIRPFGTSASIAASKGYGDCGQEALLFIALCRLNGIPARWQSGWNTFPGDKSNHDWSEIYLAPYGWMPVDPYMGIWAMRYANTLEPEQKREVRDFYFGGLDQYRMIANSDHSQTLTPPKHTMRSDDVDFQRGELECGDKNIYFNQFSYNLTLKEVKLLARGVVDAKRPRQSQKAAALAILETESRFGVISMNQVTRQTTQSAAGAGGSRPGRSVGRSADAPSTARQQAG